MQVPPKLPVADRTPRLTLDRSVLERRIEKTEFGRASAFTDETGLGF